MEILSYRPHRGERLELSAGDCHLWGIPLSANHEAGLSEGELARFHRMGHEESRRDFAASQAGLREVLSRYLKCPAHEVRLERRERGKPFLPEGPEFNLSHSGGQVIMAVATNAVGLDVERADRPVRFAGLAAKFFTRVEQNRLTDVPEAERNSLFLRHWVCKEAMVKLSGDGIYLGLRDAEVILGSDGAMAGRYRGRDVAIREFCPAPGFLAALASWQPLYFRGRYRL